MKKIYAILAAAAVSSSGIHAQDDHLALESFGQPALNGAKGHSSSRVASRAPADATWEAAGTGIWKEGLLDKLIPTVTGSSWEVTFEQAKEYPGYWRVLPYGTGTPIAGLMDQADDENYVYINATDPEKVYIEEFFAFGYIMISNLVGENNWQGYASYGTEKNGNIIFPSKSFAYTTYDMGGEFAYCNESGYLQIALPGSEIKDYLLEIDVPTCDEDGEMTISVTAGEDIAKVKMITSPGYFASSASNDRAVAANGAEFDLAKGYMTYVPGENAPTGLYTTIVVGLAEDGSIAASRCAYSHLGERDGADWTSAGTATMNEGILTTVYETATPQLLTCAAEQSVSQPGRYRLVNPYAGHTWAQSYDDFVITGHGHDHYIYINATDPAKVYVEAAPLGINTDGDAMLYSQAALYVERGQSATAVQQGLFGKLVVDDGETIITMPDGSLLFAESKYDSGAYHNVGKDFIVVINPEQVGIEEAGAAADAYAPAEYFNLQGMRVAHPRPGQLVIERRGGEVRKTIVK